MSWTASRRRCRCSASSCAIPISSTANTTFTGSNTISPAVSQRGARERQMARLLLCVAALLSLVLPAQAQKQETVTVGGKQAFLHVPANAVLIPGKGGII